MLTGFDRGFFTLVTIFTGFTKNNKISPGWCETSPGWHFLPKIGPIFHRGGHRGGFHRVSEAGVCILPYGPLRRVITGYSHHVIHNTPLLQKHAHDKETRNSQRAKAVNANRAN